MKHSQMLTKLPDYAKLDYLVYFHVNATININSKEMYLTFEDEDEDVGTIVWFDKRLSNTQSSADYFTNFGIKCSYS